MANRRILVAALDWGLGHATRMIPVIRALDAAGFEAVPASAGNAAMLLRSEFPDREVLELPRVGLEYGSGSVATSIVRQSPHLISVMRAERSLLADWIREGRFQGVISDNRYGLYNPDVPCAIVTHKIRILASVGSVMVSGLVRKLISRFDQCWVPDAEGRPLSGRLSEAEGITVPVILMGPLTRFRPMEVPLEYAVTASISGPEPHRSQFERLLRKQFERVDGKCLLVLGKPGKAAPQYTSEAHFDVATHMPSEELNRVAAASGIIVARSGYSTLMDLARLGSRAIMVPTPTQPEQEYLAERMDQIGVAPAFEQKAFDIEEALAKARNYGGFASLTGLGEPRWARLFELFG